MRNCQLPRLVLCQIYNSKSLFDPPSLDLYTNHSHNVVLRVHQGPWAANPHTALCAHLLLPLALLGLRDPDVLNSLSSIRDSFLVCAFTAPTQLTKLSAVLVLTSGTSIPEEIKCGRTGFSYLLPLLAQAAFMEGKLSVPPQASPSLASDAAHVSDFPPVSLPLLLITWTASSSSL